MSNAKVRGTRKTNGGKYGKGSGHQGATTRYLTRIISYLSDVEKANQTSIINNCFCGNISRSAKDAIQWLVSNRIIIIEFGFGQNSNSRTTKFYYLNPEYIKMRNYSQSHGNQSKEVKA